MNAEGIAIIIGAVFLGVAKIYDLYLLHRVKMTADIVKTTLADTNASTDVKLDKIHTLVNSAMLEMKRIYAVKCRAMANKAPYDQVDCIEADQAELAYNTHKAEQDREAEISGRAAHSNLPPEPFN